MIWIKMESFRGKLEVMKGRRNLRERREWITDDFTEKERSIEWLIKREASRYRKEGKRVGIGYMDYG